MRGGAVLNTVCPIPILIFNSQRFAMTLRNAYFYGLQYTMKRICLLVFVFFLFLTVSAQDCKLKRTIDPYTKVEKISTGFKRFGRDTTILLSVDATKTEIDLFFAVPGPPESHCFDNESPISFIYEGGRIKYNSKNSGSMNCEALFHVTFRNVATTPTALNNIASKKLQGVKLTDTRKGVIQINFSEEEKEKIMKMVSCVIAESKTLLK